MKLTRKIFAFVLAVSMVLSMAICGQAATFSDVPETHERYEAINELSGLGIINGYTDGTFLPDKAVTRAEMAKLIAVLFNIEEAGGGENPFTDVTNDCWALNYIIAVKNLDIINGFPDGTFLPDTEVTYEQAIKMIVCALNYGVAAEGYTVEGDWSSGYRNMASRLGITKDALMLHTDPAPRGIIAQLLYNALDVSPAVAVTGSDGKVTYKPSNDGSLRDQNSYSTLKGVQIICTPTVNLDESDKLIKDGYIRIADGSGNKYDMSVNGNTSIYDYIGKYVNVTYSEEKKDYIIKSMTTLGTEEELALESVKEFSNGKIEYYTDDKFSKTEEIDFDNATVIYNERPLTKNADYVEILNNAITKELTGDTALNCFGTLKVTEYNGNALLIVKAYKSYYMSTAVDTKNYIVTLDAGEGQTKQVEINIKDDINFEIVKKSSLTDKGSNPTALTIARNSIVTLAESHADSIGIKYIEYLVNSSKQTKTPSASESAKGPYEGKLTIDNKTVYVTNVAAWSEIEKNGVGSSVAYYTDASGNIVYLASISDGNKRFGFYTSFTNNESAGTYTFTFKDPEKNATFTATVDKEDSDIVDKIQAAKEGGKLLWMKLNNSNKIANSSDVVIVGEGTIDDADVKNVNYYTGDSVYSTSSGYTITGGINSGDIAALSSEKIAYTRPDDTTSKTLNYTKATLSSGVEYPAPEVYQIERKDGTLKTILLIGVLRKLQTSSPVYIVKEISGTISGTTIDSSIDGNIRTISYYNFKTGAEGSDELVIMDSVASTLDLEEGDIFTYYNDSDTAGVDIDNADCVFVLLRAAEAAKNRGSSFAAGTELTEEPDDKTTGFRKYRMDSNGKIASDAASKNYYNYTLQLPLWYNDDNNTIALARTVVGSTSTSDINTYLAHDKALVEKLSPLFEEGKEWSKVSIMGAMGSDVTEKQLSTSTKVFIYDVDAEGTEEEPKLTYKTNLTKDDFADLFSYTVESNKPESADKIAETVKNSVLTYTYFSSYSSNFNMLYIIK